MKKKYRLLVLLLVPIFIAIYFTFHPILQETIASEEALKLDLSYQMAGVFLGGLVAILGGLFLENTLSEDSDKQTRRNSARIIYHDIYNCLTAIYKNEVEGLRNPIFFSKSWSEHIALVNVEEKQKDLITTIYLALEKYNFHFNNFYLHNGKNEEIIREQKRINKLFFSLDEKLGDLKAEAKNTFWKDIDKLTELETEVKNLEDKNYEMEVLRDIPDTSCIIDEYISIDNFNKKYKSIKVEIQEKIDELNEYRESLQQKYSSDFKSSKEAELQILSFCRNLIRIEHILKKDYLEVLDSLKQIRHS